MAQFSGPQKQQCRQGKRSAGHRVPLGRDHVVQQRACLRRVDDRSKVTFLYGLQRVAQVGSGVTHTCPDGDAVPEHLPACTLDAMGRLDRAPALYAAQTHQQFRRLDFTDRTSTEPRKDVLLEADASPVGVPPN
jgi:hypothetical protein